MLILYLPMPIVPSHSVLNCVESLSAWLQRVISALLIRPLVLTARLILSRPHRISVDVVATSEVSVSLTLDPKKLYSGDDDMVQLKEDLDQVAQVRPGGPSLRRIWCN